MKNNYPAIIPLCFFVLLFMAPALRAQTSFIEGDALSDRTYNSDNGPTNSQLTLDFPITQAGTLQAILVWGETDGGNFSGIGQSFQAFVLRPAGTNYQIVFETTNYLTVANVGTNTFVIPGPSFGLLPGDVIAHYGRGIPFSNGTGGPSSVYINSNLPEPTNGQIIAVPGPVYPVYNDGGRNYAIQVMASTFLVTTNSDSGPGSLRQAVLSAAAIPGTSTISFAPNLDDRILIPINGQIILSNNVTIDASELPNGFGIFALGASRIFEITNNATVVLNGLTFAQGNDNNDHKFGGGCILNFGTLTVTNCSFTLNLATNSADGGGGIDNRGALTVNNCLFEENNVGWANGGAISSFGTLVVNNSTFMGNLANNSPIGGGGIYSPATLTVNNSTFNGNLANSSSLGGGAISTFGNSVNLTVNNCTFTGNQANNSYNGGGCIDSQGTLTMNNCTFTGNQATNSIVGGGGALYSYQGISGLNNCYNCIFFSDSAGAGTEIFNEGGVITVVNCLFGTNSVAAPIHNNDGGSDTEINPVGGGVDPLLAPLGNWGGPTQTMPPERGSPVIDAGDDSVTNFLATDQRGVPRKSGAHVDLGAVEIGPADTNTVVTTTADSGFGSLRLVVLDHDTFGSPNRITFTNTLSGQTILLTSGQIVLSSNATIDASALANGIQINGNGQSRIFEMNNNATVVLNSLTLTNGNDNNDDTYGGGGILNHGTLTVTNCVFTGNKATNSEDGGGGIDSYGALTVNTTTFTGNQGNSSTGGGGICSINGPTITVNNCTFTDNQANGSYAGGGGAIYASGPLTVNNSTFAGNQANSCLSYNEVAGGGGICSFLSSPLTVNNCTFNGNQANNCTIVNSGSAGGGGICSLGPSLLTVNNCTFNGNQAANSPDDGGGILVASGTSGVTNCIFYMNSASSFGTELANIEGTMTVAWCLLGPEVIGEIYSSGTTVLTNSLVGVSALLAPLGNYGGPTQTMPPEPGSPAIGAGTNSVASFLTTDQRGFPREVLGKVDIGSVEVQSGQDYSIVENTLDNGPGSLRQVVSNAPPGATITFDASLSGQIITLTSGQIVLNNSVTMIASNLLNGIYLNGNHSSRLFLVPSTAEAILEDLTLTNGFCGAGNSGGGILNQGLLIMAACTLAGNTGQYGGAIENENTCELIDCTLANDFATDNGGAIDNNNGPLILLQCTLAGNDASTGGGGGVANYLNTLAMTNCIMAGNFASGSGPDFYNFASSTINAGGTNIVQSYGNVGTLNGAGSIISANPLLDPLGNYGGPTPTLPPLRGSPAIDGGSTAAEGSITIDQRGYPRVSGVRVDIGAVEDQIASATNFLVTGFTRQGNGTIQFSLPNLVGGSFTVFATTNLLLPFNTWSNLGPVVESPIGSGNFQFTDPQAQNYSHRFYRATSP